MALSRWARESLFHDGTEGPLVMAERFLDMSCVHGSECRLQVRILYRETGVGENPAHMLRGSEVIKNFLPRARHELVACLERTADVLYRIAELNAHNKTARFSMDVNAKPKMIDIWRD